MKGGVGKTTVTMHLGGIISLYEFGGFRRKVLLIDYDPQFNLSQAFIPAKTYFELEKNGKTILKKYKILSEPLAGQGFVWHSNKPYSEKALENLTGVAEEFIKKVGI